MYYLYSWNLQLCRRHGGTQSTAKKFGLVLVTILVLKDNGATYLLFLGLLILLVLI
jgi:hypothetical protein